MLYVGLCRGVDIIYPAAGPRVMISNVVGRGLPGNRVPSKNNRKELVSAYPAAG